ncbi:MAG: response regulator [Candidatus Rokuibacteriota bacterium]
MSQAQGRALIIDDDPRIRTLLRELLEVLGYEVRSAADGTEGLSLFEPGRDKLVVTDLMMPGVTGWEVVETLRPAHPEIALVIATGSVSNLDTTRLDQLRVVVLSKPFTLEELRKAVNYARTLATVGSMATRSPGGEAVSDRETKATAVTAGYAGEWLSHLRGTADMARTLAANLAGVLAHGEEAARERDELRARLVGLEQDHRSLQAAHEALVRAMESSAVAYRQLRSEYDTIRQAFDQTNAECQALKSEKERIVQALDAVLARLRR